MASKIRCPACGKGVTPSEADAGRPVLCVACGQSFPGPPSLGALAATGAGGLATEPGEAPRVEDSVADAAGGVDGAPASDEADALAVAAAAAAAASLRQPTRPAPGSGDGATARPPGAARTQSMSHPQPDRKDGRRGHRLAWLGWGVAAGLGVAWLLQALGRSDTTDPPEAAVIVAPPQVGHPAAPFDSPAAERTLPSSPAPAETGVHPSVGPAPSSLASASSHPATRATDGSALTPSSSERQDAEVSVAAAGAGDDLPGRAGPASTRRSDGAHHGADARPEMPAPASDDESAAVEGRPDKGPDASPDEAAAETRKRPATAPSSASSATADARQVRRRRGPLRPIPPDVGEVSDGQIEASIRRAVDFLMAQYDVQNDLIVADGNTGVQFLATYALLQAGATVKDPRLEPRGALVDAMLERIKLLPIEPSQATYQRSVRAAALALLNRPQDRAVLREDVRRLIVGHVSGGYTYGLAGGDSRESRGTAGGVPGFTMNDNSNSQYGLLGVWSGADAGVEVPSKYWQAVDRYWVDGQLTGGSWAYTPDGTNAAGGGSGYVAMTAAGTASLFVTHDQLSRGTSELGRDPFSPALERALRWWESTDDWLKPVDPRSPFNGRYWTYQLYGIERVGLASGFKYFGEHDWYRLLARQAVDAQGPDGSWGSGNPIDTSFALLFLARGRPPLMMNKLRFEGYWANRPRDLANLTRFVSRATERPLNWQIVDVRTEWHDWLDAPMLYLASHRAPRFTDVEYDKLRSYALAGGMIVTHADGGRKPFDAFVSRLARELFPRYELKDLPPNHPIFNIVGKVEPKPKLRAVSNGSRILMLYSPAELSMAWQARDDKRRANVFNLGLNLFVYATGKRDLRNRLDSPYVPPPPQLEGRGRDPIRVARLKYAGHWDPEPAAWQRFARLFLRRTGTVLEPVTVKWADLTPETAPLAHLTGTALYGPTPAEVAALRTYVEGGGVLLVDNCGGMGAFAGEVKSVLGEAFPRETLDPLRYPHPLLSAGEPGMADLSKPKYRPFAAERQGGRPGLHGFAAGKGQVLLTTLDVTSGLLHTGTWGIYGYDPTYCESLVQNLALWAHDTQPE